MSLFIKFSRSNLIRVNICLFFFACIMMSRLAQAESNNENVLNYDFPKSLESVSVESGQNSNPHLVGSSEVVEPSGSVDASLATQEKILSKKKGLSSNGGFLYVQHYNGTGYQFGTQYKLNPSFGFAASIFSFNHNSDRHLSYKGLTERYEARGAGGTFALILEPFLFPENRYFVQLSSGVITLIHKSTTISKTFWRDFENQQEIFRTDIAVSSVSERHVLPFVGIEAAHNFNKIFSLGLFARATGKSAYNHIGLNLAVQIPGL